ncbi:MAG: arginine--tRNA ligase [Aquificaceae bacterium]|nr:arginine--tRNA ligase [Aquificaceae bacterium]MCX8060784.1 arginine--tRNA ligase [Aquificaceae bacterium]MDW8097519.1 arginine--tRNA ligase [Aquificaceae bacterium]
MKELLLMSLRDTLESLYQLVPEDLTLSPPREESHGDYSTNVAFLLAKTLKKSPKDIAQQIADSMPKESFKVEAVNGFINFRLRPALLTREFARLIKDGETYFFRPVERPLFVQIEFVSANPTGPLHVGHGRGAVVGDVLSRIFQRFGHKVVREYYINDAGNQVKMLGLSVFYRYCQLWGREREDLKKAFEEEGYKGRYVIRLAKDLKAFYGEKLLELPQEEALTLAKEYAHRRLLEDIRETLELLGVGFDSWFSERSLYQRGLVQEVLELLEKKGHLYQQEGALWFRSSAFGDDKDRVVRKSDGSYTYFASDVAYHWEKHRRGFQRVINLWGADHHGYEKRLLGALRALGVEEGWLKVEFVQMVRLLSGGQEVRMSKRTGEFVTLQELLEEVGPDAVRFVFLTRDSDTPLDFDMDLVKRNTSENPVFYVQYAYARIRGVFREVRERYGLDPDQTDLTSHVEGLRLEEELKLVKKCLQMKDIYETVLQNLSPHLITYALLELSKDFHFYYNHHRVMVEDTNLMLSRLALLKGVEVTLKTAFDLLGIKAPERM